MMIVMEYAAGCSLHANEGKEFHEILFNFNDLDIYCFVIRFAQTNCQITTLILSG